LDAAVALAILHLTERGPHSYLSDADMLDYVAICQAASQGFGSLQQLLSLVDGTGSNAQDLNYAERWFRQYQKISEKQ
jgi:hypothetical protein